MPLKLFTGRVVDNSLRKIFPFDSSKPIEEVSTTTIEFKMAEDSELPMNYTRLEVPGIFPLGSSVKMALEF